MATLGHFSWILFEGSWLALVLLFLGIAWFTQTVRLQLSLNLFIHGLFCLCLFLSQGMFISSVSKEILLLFLFSKLIFVSLFLFINKRILDVYINVYLYLVNDDILDIFQGVWIE